MIKLLEFISRRIMYEMDKQNVQTPRKFRLNRDDKIDVLAFENRTLHFVKRKIKKIL